MEKTLTLREKKEYLIANAHFDRREFAFFESNVPETVQHTCLDYAISAYNFRKAQGVPV